MSNRAITASTAILLTGSLAGAAMAQESDAGPSLPLAYQYELPYQKMDGDKKVVTVRHNADGLSIAHVHAAGEDTPLMSDDPEDFSLSSSAMFLAGPATDGRIASPEPIAGGVLINDGPPAFETGQRYSDGEAYNPETDDPAPSWSVDNLETSFADGDNDRTIAGLETDHRQLTVSYDLTRYGSDGEVRQEGTVSSTRDFWFTQALPYSPLQTIPNIYDSAYFTPSGLELLDEAIQERVAGEMTGSGAVLAQEGEGASGLAGSSSVTELEETDAFLPETLSAIPILPGAQADTMLGALFVTEMLKDADRIPEGGNLSLDIGEGLSADTGRAAWREMRNGDFGIALHPEEGTAEDSVLLLMRPVNGVPAPGSYDVAGVMSREALAELDDAPLAAYANKFQPMGTVRHDGQDYVVTGFSEGTVMIDESGNGTVSGSVDGVLELLTIDGSQVAVLYNVSVEFEAVEGLEARFQSPVARVMGQ